MLTPHRIKPAAGVADSNGFWFFGFKFYNLFIMFFKLTTFGGSFFLSRNQESYLDV
jgi:hypothetical protein